MSESSRWTEEEMETAKKGNAVSTISLRLKVPTFSILMTQRNNASNFF